MTLRSAIAALITLAGLCDAPVAAQTATEDTQSQASQGATQTSDAPAEKALCPVNKLCVGVRSNVQPFVSRTRHNTSANLTTKSGPLHAAGYRGYMVYICDKVLKEMAIAQKDVPPLEITDVLTINVPDGGARFTMLDSGEIDILCDPATITPDRVLEYAVSPPLFATGISFLQLKKTPPLDERAVCADSDTALIGVVGNTTAFSLGVDAILASGEWGRYSNKIQSSLLRTDPGACFDPPKADDESDNGAGETVMPDPRAAFRVIRSFRDHRKLAQAFCQGRISFYVGDLEIITTHARTVAGCDFSRAARSYTSDRYGVFAHIDYTDQKDKALLIGRFFEVLNREIAGTGSLLDRAYLDSFPGYEPSRALELFYWSMRGAN